MAVRIPDKIEIENFTVENNVLKGINLELYDNANVGEVILDSLNSDLDHVAQIDAETDDKTTFSEMKDRSIRCALWMEKQGIKPGDIITVCTHNHLNTYVPVFATFYVGAVFNGWDHELSLKSASHLVQFFKPKLIFACESAVENILEAAKSEKINTEIIVFGKYPGLKSLDDILQNKSADKILNYRPVQITNVEETAIILLTSGSSGTPKGVMHSYKNAIKLVQAFQVYPFKDVSLCNSTVYWLTGIMLLLVTTLTRGTRIIHKKWDIGEGCRIIEKYKVKRLFISPLMIAYFCKLKRHKAFNLDSVELVFTGGSKINQRMLDGFKELLPNATIIQSYGLTEAGRMVASQTENTKNINSVGFVTLNTEIKILDVLSNEILGPNQEGEICVKQSTLMTGYFKNPEESRKAVDKEGWLHTGDMGVFDDNGEITVTGRYKDIIKCRDYQISPAEIEEILLSHPSVLEVAVVPIPHEIDVEQPIAFVKRRAEVTEDELVRMSLVLGEHKKLRGGVEFLDDLPKTPSGKLNKPVLKEMAKTLKRKRDLEFKNLEQFR